MNEEIVAELKSWFASYVETFKSGDANGQQNIALKEEHTL